ncbi:MULTISPECIES: CoA transferase [unclassified Mycobacterium]|uniref:CaiB/BaiF CoA-transferase family protein n=1 Tax=unclassified Mycobacterium TaxID=2642494 RepID=UPI000740292D|nr:MULTISPECIES: CoA transferase [unclassified Mycobacterium]KUH80263.1 CoA-transferase [Mycobacterium sp. GA-0227b]KUH81815.1 CoA-transferase [Mycobacterium sp. GA-1999]
MAALDDYTVIDLSSGIAGAYCTKLLADGGATVVKVESPEGDPLRTWSASGARIEPGSDGALFSFLSCSKYSVVVDPQSADDVELLRGLLRSADAVVWSRGSTVAALDEFAPAAIADAYSDLTVTAISPFGLEGPWADKPATEFTVQAWSGGVIGLGRGAQDRAPLFVAGQIGEWLTGAFAAAGTMATAAGLVDVSMLETEILSLTYYSVSFHDALGRPFRDRRRLTIPGVASAADGLVALGCGTAQQWFDLCAMVGHDEWIDEQADLSITEQANIHAEQIYAWVRDNRVEDILELSSAFRIPNAPVGNGANVTSFDHFEERGTFVTNPRDGFTQPGAPYRTSPSLLRKPRPAPRLGEHTEQYRLRTVRQGDPLTAERSSMYSFEPSNRTRVSARATESEIRSPIEGLRVLDLTSFWAGPSCTHALALLGAEVIHVESTARPDGTRLIAGVPTSEEQWWERSPIFSGLNTNKKSVTLDIRSDRGVELLRELVKTCDVIVENYTPRVLDQIGLDFDAVHRLRPDAIMMRMPGFGLDGPWRDKPAFAYVIEDCSGMTWLTGHPDQNPVEPYSVGDPNAGVHGLNALLLALAHRRRTGEGVRIEAAMVDAALNVAAEQVVEYSAYGNLLQRQGNRGPTAAPQNLYRTGELDEFGRPDDWVAIAVATDEQWAALVAALGDPAWATEELTTLDGRRRHHDAIDDHLSRWCGTRTGDQIVETLWEAGVPVAKVMQPHRVGELPQVVHRGFYEHVDHPVNPMARHSTLPMRISSARQGFHRSPAPLLGQHNHEVLAGLGLSDDEIIDLERQGVIGNAPKGLTIRTTKTG